MRYLRFLVAPVVLSLVFAYLLPSAGITLASGVTGLLTAAGLGVAYCTFFAVYRLAEHWFISRFTTDRVQAYSVAQLSVLLAMGLVALSLFGLQWLMPQFIQVAGWAPAALAGFWLGVIGLSLTPSPALVRSFRQSEQPAEPAQPEPLPPPPEDKTSGPNGSSSPSAESPEGPQS